MMSVKLLMLTVLVGVVTATTSHKRVEKTSILPWQLGDTVHKVVHTATGLLGGTSVQVDTGLVSVGFFARGIVDHNSRSYKAFKSVGQRRQIGSYNDILDILFTITKGVDDLLNKGWISGIGKLLSRLIIATFRISDCVLGLGVRSPTGSQYAKPIKVLICSNTNYGKQWGWLPYRGSYGSTTDIIKFYKLDGVVKQLLKLLQIKGGIKNLNGYPKHVSQALLKISIRFDSCRRYNVWSRIDVNYIVAQLIKIIALVTDSYHPSLGKYVTDELLNLLNNKKYARPYGLNLGGLIEEIGDITSIHSKKQWLLGVKISTDDEFYNADTTNDEDDNEDSPTSGNNEDDDDSPDDSEDTDDEDEITDKTGSSTDDSETTVDGDEITDKAGSSTDDTESDK